MRSRWVVAAAVLGGALASPALATLFLAFFATFTYGRFDEATDFAAAAFLVFTLLTVPIAALVVWTGNGRQRGFAAGLLLGWAALGTWVWMGVPEVEFT
jgi:hypothetical protein